MNTHFRFGGFAVQHGCKNARRIIKYRSETARKDKRLANRAYRRAFKRAVSSGIESVSEFDPPRYALLTPWDIS